MELIKCIDPNEGEALKRGREGVEGRGRGAAENCTWGAELTKCIDLNEGEALRKGAVERGGRGRGGEDGREGNFTWGVELIKCIDPNEGDALRRGSTFKPGGLAPPTPLFHRLWGRGARGREAGGRI